MQPLILDLNFWHQSFLTTIMVDHYPLSEFLQNSSFMLCSFGISIEASAPAVLSFNTDSQIQAILLIYTISISPVFSGAIHL